MEPFLDEILSYFARHIQEIASYSAAASALAALLVVLLTLRQLRGAKLNREVALSQLEVTKEQSITARNQKTWSYKAIDQQKRAARIAEEVKLDNQAPDLAIIEYGPVKTRVGGHEKLHTADYDWVFSEENDSVLPERFSITFDTYSWWAIWVAGSLLIRNEGSRTVVLGPDLTHRWVGDAPPKSGNSSYVVSPGDEFRLEWFNSYALQNWRLDALQAKDPERLGVDRQNHNKLIVVSAHIPELYDICSITYTWYPVYKAFNSDDEYSFVDHPPEVVIKRRRFYPASSDD